MTRYSGFLSVVTRIPFVSTFLLLFRTNLVQIGGGLAFKSSNKQGSCFLSSFSCWCSVNEGMDSGFGPLNSIHRLDGFSWGHANSCPADFVPVASLGSNPV